MSNAVQVARIIEAALTGDASKVRSYGELIAGHFEQDNDDRSARIVRRALGIVPPGAPAALDSDLCPICCVPSAACLCNYSNPSNG